MRLLDLSPWADTQIQAGDKWRQEIQEALDRAHVAVLLVTPEFLASKFIKENELPPLLKSDRVLWVAVSASGYKQTPIADYQSTNDPSKPLDMLSKPKRNQAWVEIAEKIQEAVNAEPKAADFTAYLKGILASTDHINIGGIGSGAGRVKTATRFPIERIYTPLRSRGERQEIGEGGLVLLSDILPRHRRLLIEGQPGAGKTTFTRLVTAVLARDWLEGTSSRKSYLGLKTDETPPVPAFLRLGEDLRPDPRGQEHAESG